jgi:hypothetical protein
MLKYISIFPNPAHDKLQILFSKPFDSMTIKLLDVNGKAIKTLSANNKNNVTVNCEGATAGSYILQFNSGRQIVCRKIIIR